MNYAHINVKYHTKVTIYNYAEIYNINARAYKYHSPNRAYKYSSHRYTLIIVQRKNGKTPILDAIWYSAMDITFKPRTLSSSAL